MSFWPRRPPKGARRAKLKLEPAPEPTPAKAALQPRKRPAKLAAAKPAVASRPRKPFALVVGSGSVLGVASLMAVLLAWGVGMTLVAVFSDQMSVRLMAQYSEMQDTYERKVQDFRDEAARLFEEQQKDKVDKDTVLGRVEELLRRQRAIETRQNLLDKLITQIGVDPRAAPAAAGAAPTVETPMPPVRPGFPTRPAGQTRGDVAPDPMTRFAAADMQPSPPSVRLAALPGEGAPSLVFAQAFDNSADPPPTAMEAVIEGQIERIERAMRAADTTQVRLLGGLVRYSGKRLEYYRNALTTLGLTPEGVAPDNGRTPANLALLSVPISEQRGPFATAIRQINGDSLVLFRIRPALGAMPLARPTTTEARFASPFGFRIHPISHVRKLHAGLDLAAPLGTPIRAAGAGVVLSAGWGGGYGNLVQIDHGNGVVSRYAHMSEIEVAQGQPIAAGAIVGKMGSTGASTGSHLHFETRIKGSPHNPACFLIAGDRLRDAPSPGFTCEKPPFAHDAASSEEEDDDS